MPTTTVRSRFALLVLTCALGLSPWLLLSFAFPSRIPSAVAAELSAPTAQAAPLGWGIAVTKTVGTQPGVCSPTQTLTVSAGTRVYYCVTVTNTGTHTLTRHTLVDSHLGSWGFNAGLPPGASLSTVARGLTLSAVLEVTTTNTITWTAQPFGYESVSATAHATVYVTPLPNLSRYYVDARAGTNAAGAAETTGANDGSSWAAAFADLQTALARADAGDEIWVAAGLYLPTADADPDASFILKPGVALYGGFAGTEITRDPRDWQANPTILSGDIGVTGDGSDNSITVVTSAGLDATAILDGFVIQSAATYGLYNPSGSPTLTHLTFTENGVGLYIDSGSPALTGVRFSRNGEFGGMVNLHGSPTLTDVTFSQNTLFQGAVLYNSGVITLTRVAFIDNLVGLLGASGMQNTGVAYLTNVLFARNAGQREVVTGALDNSGSATLTNVLFYANNVTFVRAGRNEILNTGALTLTQVTAGFQPFVPDPEDPNPDEWHTGPALVNRSTGTLLLQNSIVCCNPNGDVLGLYTAHNSLIGNRGDPDPRFVDPDHGDFHLQPASPTLDTGDNALLPADLLDLDANGNTAEPLPFDLGDQPRLVDGNTDGAALVDMGAYEFQPSAQVGQDDDDAPILNQELRLPLLIR